MIKLTDILVDRIKRVNDAKKFTNKIIPFSDILEGRLISELEQWIDELRIQENVIVSSKYHSRTIEQRIRVDEAIQLKREMETQQLVPQILVAVAVAFGMHPQRLVQIM